MDLVKILSLSQAEKEKLMDSGIFNTMIEGYLIMAMEDAGFSKEEISRIQFTRLFDNATAADALNAAYKF